MTSQGDLAVDPGAVDTRGKALVQSADSSRRIGVRVQAALEQLEQAAGVASLNSAALDGASQWGAGLNRVAAAGESLGLATQASAQAYRDVERASQSRFLPSTAAGQ
ncbi:hypothetical protein K0651_00885 [Ornithinimicrobium sp. Arc0846-15]|nr:hypothetical protein [Ornithinimicrobium laminariae]